MELSPLVITGLFFVALVAGLVDAIAGGGGLLTVPALLATGLPTPMVFGTNKGSAVFGSGAALLRFWRARMIDGPRARLLFPLGMAGSFAGAALLTWVDPKILRPLVLVLLVVAGFIVAFVRPPPPREGAPTPGASWKTAVLALGIGAYDGFFGPGTGSFLVFLFVRWLGYDFLHASASAKLLNTASNLAALSLFALKGHVWWHFALVMAVANVAGSLLGTRLALKHGSGFVRWVFIGVVTVLIARTTYDAWLR